MISITTSGSFKNTEKFLSTLSRSQMFTALDGIAKEGVNALSTATPVETGRASSSWDYEIKIKARGCAIYWTNSDIENGFPVAVMAQYGHGTGTGGYVQGTDYINPALKPIFDRMADKVWKAVTSA